MQGLITTILITPGKWRVVTPVGKGKCSGVCLSPVNRKAEDHQDHQWFLWSRKMNQMMACPLPCLWTGWVYVGSGLVSAQPSEKKNPKQIVQKAHSFGAFWVFMAFAHREVCYSISFYLGTFALQTCRCSVPSLSLLSCLANHRIMSNLIKFAFPFMSSNLSF